MIYMVEMGFPHPDRLPEWHNWYMRHIGVLLTVPGFRASQRFEAVLDNPSPYLALHEVASADLFQSDASVNTATRYVHPRTGKSVAVDDRTGEVLHVGGQGFMY